MTDTVKYIISVFRTQQERSIKLLMQPVAQETRPRHHYINIRSMSSTLQTSEKTTPPNIYIKGMIPEGCLVPDCMRLLQLDKVPLLSTLDKCNRYRTSRTSLLLRERRHIRKYMNRMVGLQHTPSVSR